VPLCIHRAPLGTHERMIGFLIEHFAGLFPLWLAPVQVAVLPVASAHETYARDVDRRLRDSGIRVEFMSPEESLGKRIREGEKLKIPYLLVLGDKEAQSQTVTARNVKTKQQVPVALAAFADSAAQEIRSRALEYSIGS